MANGPVGIGGVELDDVVGADVLGGGEPVEGGRDPRDQVRAGDGGGGDASAGASSAYNLVATFPSSAHTDSMASAPASQESASKTTAERSLFIANSSYRFRMEDANAGHALTEK